MIRRLKSLLMGLTALLAILLLGIAPVQANTALEAYQPDHQIVSSDQHAIHLTALGNFDYHAKIASECCNATNNGAGYPSLARPSTDAQGNVIFGSLDDLGRPTGVTSTITSDMIGTGSSANPAIRPPGFGGQAEGHAHGHLLANILGGSGNDFRNLVTLFQNSANRPIWAHRR